MVYKIRCVGEPLKNTLHPKIWVPNWTRSTKLNQGVLQGNLYSDSLGMSRVLTVFHLGSTLIGPYLHSILQLQSLYIKSN